jgi:hypothetical protein
MSEIVSYDPTTDGTVDETPETEEKEGAVEAFGRKLINESKICSALAEYIKQSRGESIPRVLQDPELKKIVREHSDEKNFYNTLAVAQEAIDKVNIARGVIHYQKTFALAESKVTGEPWEKILTKNFFVLEEVDGDVEVLDNDFYLTFLPKNLSDYGSIHSGSLEDAVDLGGFANSSKNVPYTVINPYQNKRSQEISISHEEQHAFNSIILERAESELNYTNRFAKLGFDKENPPTQRTLAQTLTNLFTDLYAQHIKDEILAYSRDQKSNRSLPKLLTGTMIASYYETAITDVSAFFENEIIEKKLLPQNLMTNREYANTVVSFTEKAFLRSAIITKEWINDANTIFEILEKTEKRQDIIFMLGLVPIKKWGRIARVFEKIEQNKLAKDETNQAESHEEEADLSLEMIKHESLTNEAGN